MYTILKTGNKKQSYTPFHFHTIKQHDFLRVPCNQIYHLFVKTLLLQQLSQSLPILLKKADGLEMGVNLAVALI